jgi:hypothetical protein
LARLRAAFVASPGLAVYSRSPTHFEHIAGTDDGAMLLAAVTTVLDRTDRVALLQRTRAEIHGLTITELCDAKGWHRAVSTGGRTQRQSEWRRTSTNTMAAQMWMQCSTIV